MLLYRHMPLLATVSRTIYSSLDDVVASTCDDTRDEPFGAIHAETTGQLVASIEESMDIAQTVSRVLDYYHMSRCGSKYLGHYTANTP